MSSPDASLASLEDAEPIPMTFDELFTALPRVPGGKVYMAMPYSGDMSMLRAITSTLLPMGIEILVDNEVVFVYAKTENVDADAAALELSINQQRAVAAAIQRYQVVLRAFLSIYACKGRRIWASASAPSMKKSGFGGRGGQDGNGRDTK